MASRGPALVVATVIALVASRIAVVLTGSHLVSHYEELYRGTIAREVLEGLHAPLWSYQADHYSGGSLVVGLLAAPAIALLGPCLLALKLVPIAFAAATAGLAVRLLAARFGTRAAVAGALLLVTPPPALVQLESLAKGFHTESPLFTLAALSALLTFVWDGRRRRWLFAAGFAGGLGISFTPIAALGLAGVVVTWVVLERARIRRTDALTLALGIALGAAPAIAYAVAHGLTPGPPSLVEVVGTTSQPLGIYLAKIPARVVKLVVLALPLSAGFPDVGRLSGLGLSALYGVLALGSVAILVVREARARGPALLALAIPAAVFVALYALSPIAIPTGTSAWASRHLAPLHVLSLLLVAVAVTRIRRGTVVLVGLVLLGGVGHASLLFSERPGRAWTERADSYYHLGMLWTLRAGRTLAALDVVQVRLERLAVDRRDAAYRGAIDALEPLDHELTPAALPRLFSRVSPSQHPVVWEALGRWLGERPGLTAGDVAARLEALPPRGRRLACMALELSRAHLATMGGLIDLHGGPEIAPKPPDARSAPGNPGRSSNASDGLDQWTSTSPAGPCVAEDRRLGLGYLLATYRSAGAGCAALRKTVADLDPEPRRAVYRGAGRGAAVVEIARTGIPAGVFLTGIELGDVACLRPPARGPFQTPDGVATLAAAVPPGHLEDFFWGVGWEIADLFSEDPPRAAHTIADLPQPAQAPARAGATARVQTLIP